MGSTDIRWKQRFQNFEKAFQNLNDAIHLKSHSKLEKAGLIQYYEFTFELAWKTLKDFLEDQKVEVKFPRDVIKEAFKSELLEDGEMWMDMLDKRNLMSHTYDELTSELAYELITNQFFGALEKVYLKLKYVI